MILHGTDTLAYTSSALSFMLENLGKPVRVTMMMIVMMIVMIYTGCLLAICKSENEK